MSLAKILEGKLGTELSQEDQRYVLSAYVYRYTRDHKPAWANAEWKDGKPYPVQFRSDAEWLANSRFAVLKDGRLDRSVRECHSHPTWPDNPEMAEAWRFRLEEATNDTPKLGKYLGETR